MITHAPAVVLKNAVVMKQMMNGGIVGSYSRWTEAERKFVRLGESPHFMKLKREGGVLPMNDLYAYTQRVESLGGPRSFNGWGNTYSFSPKHLWSAETLMTDPVALVQSLIDQAGIDPHYYVQAAAASISEQSYDALTAVLELNQARQMFASIGRRVLHEIDRSGAWNIGQLANDWMEGRYGWRTLVYDLQALSTKLSDISTGILGRKRWDQREGTTVPVSITETTSVADGSFGAVDQHLVLDAEVSCRGRIVADIIVPNFQLSVLNTAWELVPFSFVFDWLVNVGQALSAGRFLFLQQRYVAAYGYRVEYTRTVTLNRTGSSGPITNINYSNTYRETGVCNIRVPVRTSLLPRMKINIDAFKIVDLLAMALQIFRRNLPRQPNRRR